MSVLVSMILSLCTRVRWKLAHFKHPEWRSTNKNYGFKTPNQPPPDDDLKLFEEMMLDIPNRIKFKDPRNAYQKELKKKVAKINQQDRIIARADKTRNNYLIKTEDYNRMLSNAVTKDFKKNGGEVIEIINKEAAKITDKLEISDRVDKFRLQDPFCLIKDHKDSFPARVEVRMVNPSKSNIGIISKQILDRVNNVIKVKLKLRQWKSTGDVLEWFDNIDNKGKKTFFQFDIVQFYPSISEKLCKELIKFARKHTDITKEEEEILYNARKQILYWNGQTWTKANGKLFDVGIGSLDGAEFCELTGLYALYKLTEALPDEDLGLYRDDGLGVTEKSGPGSARIEKTLHRIFKSMDLKITTEVNVKKVNFLDVILDLNSGRRAPFRKPLDNPIYVNANSSHPPSVIKQIPKSVQDRLSVLSSTKAEFDLAAPPYIEALKKAGYKNEIKYEKPEKKNRKNRSRNTLWFNPPFALNVATNLTKMFAEIIDKAFPKNHRYLRKLFNKNNMKLSYSTTPNMGNIISAHNKKILRKSDNNDVLVEPGCNCRNEEECPMQNKCLTAESVYRATVSSEDGKRKIYTGAAATTFKLRYGNHKQSFNNRKYASDSTLSKYIWELKDRGVNFEIKWHIVKRSKGYDPVTQKCRLCLDEKLEIMRNCGNQESLNSRNELFSKCRHRRKHLLESVVK